MGTEHVRVSPSRIERSAVHSRRGFLKLVGAASTAFVATGLLAACGDDDDDGGDEPTEGATAAPSGPTATTAAGATEPAGEATMPAGDVQEGGELIVGLASDPQTLDPHKTNLRVAQHVMMTIYDTLVIKDSEGEFFPALAESWEVSEDGTEWTLVIREGVVFHDGSTLDASSVKFAFDRVLDPETRSPLSKTMVGPLETVEAPDATTVVMQFPTAFAPFMEGISQSFLGIPSPQGVEEFGEDFGQNPVGSGPFAFREYTQGTQIVVEKNPDYAWGPEIFNHTGPAYIDTLTFRIIVENASRMATVETGETQIGERVPDDDVERLQGTDGLDVFVFPAPGLGDLIVINVERPIVSDVNVRKALNLAVDRDALSEGLFAGLSKPLYSPLRPNMLGYWPEAETEGYGYDPEQAAQLLEEAGWTQGSGDFREKDGETLTLQYPTGQAGIFLRYAEAFQAMARDVGVEVVLTSLEAAALNARVDAGDYDLVATRWTWPDPDILYTIFHSSQIGADGNNDSRYVDPDLDQLLDDGRTTVDPDERVAFYVDAQMILIEQAVSIPLLHPNEIFVYRLQVHDFKIDPRSYMWLYDVWIES